MILMLPFFIQFIVISIDEYFFHLRRGLPKWERVGHPLDTLSVIICLLFVLFIPYSTFALKWFAGLGLISCLLVTKDEFVHKHHCPAAEQWLHALLFLNHPILLACMGLMWRKGSFSTFLVAQTALATLFFFYQVIYWNFVWKSKTQ